MIVERHGQRKLQRLGRAAQGRAHALHFRYRAAVHHLDGIFGEALLERANLRNEFAVAREIKFSPGVLPIDLFVDHLVGARTIKNDRGAGAVLREKLEHSARSLARE